MKTRPTIATALALVLAACGSNEAAEPVTEESTVPPEAVVEGPSPSTPQGFVDLAASSDMYEIEAGKLAQEMGSSEAVKEFGAMMEQDHTASSAKLKGAVAEAGDGLTVPTAMLPKHEQQLDALRNAGDRFDSLYAQQQVAAHQEALTLLRGQAATGTEDALKAFAAEAFPVVQGHYDHASDLGGDAGGGE